MAQAPVAHDFEANIQEGQRLRGWLTNAYAQIEFLLGDLILRCRMFPAYDEETRSFTHSAPKRVEKVRRILEKAGPLSAFRDQLIPILDAFGQNNETRNLLVHGYCEYLYTPLGDACLQFQKWHRQPDRDDARLIRQFRIATLAAECDAMVALSQQAQIEFQRIHTHFGWARRRD